MTKLGTSSHLHYDTEGLDSVFSGTSYMEQVGCQRDPRNSTVFFESEQPLRRKTVRPGSESWGHEHIDEENQLYKVMCLCGVRKICETITIYDIVEGQNTVIVIVIKSLLVRRGM